ncbi:hypothetical protein J4228_02315 [Candidatus Woesearchaeota archaeon]|nr:hypothetical protein [Candidatus Woesearchaeota archaeon]
MKMIELKRGLYIRQGDRYEVLLKNRAEVVYGKIIARREVRGDYRHSEYQLTGIIKDTEKGMLVFSPATVRSTYAVDFGHVYEITKEHEEIKIPIKNIEQIIGMEDRKCYELN